MCGDYNISTTIVSNIINIIQIKICSNQDEAQFKNSHWWYTISTYKSYNLMRAHCLSSQNFPWNKRQWFVTLSHININEAWQNHFFIIKSSITSTYTLCQYMWFPWFSLKLMSVILLHSQDSVHAMPTWWLVQRHFGIEMHSCSYIKDFLSAKRRVSAATVISLRDGPFL